MGVVGLVIELVHARFPRSVVMGVSRVRPFALQVSSGISAAGWRGEHVGLFVR